MYYLFTLIVGILITATVPLNGQLSGMYGLYSSSVIVHITGLVLIFAIVVFKRDRPFSGMRRWFLYLGGAVGYLTLVFNIFAFGRISVSAIMALGLFGQSVTSLFVDSFGLWGMTKRPFNKRRLIGLLIIFAGIASMINNFELAAMALSFAAGFTAVAARTLNAKLSDLTNVRISTLYNYITGVCTAFIVFLLLGCGEPIWSGFAISPRAYIYLGGILGVILVAISNAVVTKISAFYFSLFLFVGQVFSGILIDRLVLGSFSARILIGGVLVTVGMGADLLLSNNTDKYPPLPSQSDNNF